MKMSSNMITDLKHVKGGQTYIKVMCLDGKMHISTEKVVGVPYKEIGSWSNEVIGVFGKTRSPASWRDGDHEDKFSYEDRNIIANRYNDHSMWRFSNRVLNYLQGLSECGEDGVEEYLAHLAHHKRGVSFHGTRQITSTHFDDFDWDETMWA